MNDPTAFRRDCFNPNCASLHFSINVTVPLWAPTSSAPMVCLLTPAPGSQPPMMNSLRLRCGVLIQSRDRSPGV